MRLPKIKIIAAISVLLLSFAAASHAADDGAITFSVSPPLFKVSMKPLEGWTSFIKVINNNPYPVAVYAEVVNFKSNNEGGVEFIRGDNNTYSKYMLSQWITLGNKEISIPAFSSQDVPFAISLPANADPGGHYAAILLGNKPTDDTVGNVIKFSSKIASLILVKVDGEVREQGDVTEFSSKKLFNDNLSAALQLKFKNQGNVHIHPEGHIRITNIFGEERGHIEVNSNQSFGNVLPESEKRWEFGWQGSNSILDAGPMKAELLLSYGDEGKQTAYRAIYFWTINLRPTLIAVSIVIVMILSIIWLIRRFIRRSVEQMRAQLGLSHLKKAVKKAGSKAMKSPKIQLINKPLKKHQASMYIKILNWTLLKKSLLASIVAVVVLMCLALYVYNRKYGFFDDTYVPEDPNSVIIAPAALGPAAASTTPEDDGKVRQKISSSTAPISSKDVSIIDGSGQRDLRLKIWSLLTANNVIVTEATTSEMVYDDIAVVIKFRPEQLAEAQKLDELLNKQAELRQEETPDGRIIVVLGSRFK